MKAAFYQSKLNIVGEKNSLTGEVKQSNEGWSYCKQTGVGLRKPPLGYTYNHETSIFQIDKVLDWVIPAIDKMYLESGMGMKAIADRLNELSEILDLKCWNASLVDTALTSKAYHGVMEVTLRSGETISIEDKFPPLRTEETWRKIQAMRYEQRMIIKRIQKISSVYKNVKDKNC
ncbi:recombinase family protein [Bacillus salacetis]|uniref:recombinase family protein n=1 Tax=Bacillus salacetis TaxID=2315464 RepID=UPI003BA0E5EF